MQKAEFIEFMGHPVLLNSETLNDLIYIRELYPYFQSAHLLVLKNKFILQTGDLQPEMDAVAVHVTDRRVLYDLLYPIQVEPAFSEVTEPGLEVTNEPAAEVPQEPVVIDTHAPSVEDANEPVVEQPADEIETARTQTTLRDNISNLLSWQLEELELMDPDEAKLLPEIGIDIEKTYGQKESGSSDEDLLTLDIESDQGNEPDVANKNLLIDKFIETNPRILPRPANIEQVDISEDSVKEHDGIFTDTLARIYIKQGYYSKAIFTYEKLILKYPEKSDYFASQIEAIKKLTNKQ